MEIKQPAAEEAGQCAAKITCLHGHIYALRRFGALAFIVLRHQEGLTQVVVDDPALLAQTESMSCEMAIRVKGVMQAQEGKVQQMELRACEIEVLSGSGAVLPLELAREKRMASLSLNTLLEYRPLTLRNEKVRAIFKIEAELCRAFREFLSGEKFTEIHSPKIVATGTEGGAQVFEVNYFGNTAYLAQSPQFYKQIMVGVFERVFEIGPVYRAEEHNTARHLNEYVSMDFEMGFIQSEQEIINLQIRLIKHMFESLREHCSSELALHAASVPLFETIPQIKHEEAMQILESKLGWTPTGEDFDPEAERLLCEYMSAQHGSELVYVTHYPASVRPFYAMPESGTSKSHSFDLLFRGSEITTGGQRIHEFSQLCQSIEGRGMEPSQFADYLQCFKFGMPPHGGLAFGLERLTKQLLKLKNVREASLFPRDRTRISP